MAHAVACARQREQLQLYIPIGLQIMHSSTAHAGCEAGLAVAPWPMQLHAQGSGNSCSADGKLILAQRDLRDIFVASTAELPGLLAAALIMDVFGRKWYGPPLRLAHQALG